MALISILLTIPSVLLALSCHEAAHGYIAYKMGDRTAYNLGRVTLNPFKHFDPIGAICMLVFGYGWAKPVPINTRNFKNPKWGMALSALAGPMANFLLGIIGTILSFVVFAIGIYTDTWGSLETAGTAVYMAYIFFDNFAFLNFLYMVFNLIPVPPFDGSRIFSAFLPAKTYFAIMKYERYYLLIVLGISIVCSRVFNFSPFTWLAELVYNLVRMPLSLLLNLIF